MHLFADAGTAGYGLCGKKQAEPVRGDLLSLRELLPGAGSIRYNRGVLYGVWRQISYKRYMPKTEKNRACGETVESRKSAAVQ